MPWNRIGNDKRASGKSLQQFPLHLTRFRKMSSNATSGQRRCESILGITSGLPVTRAYSAVAGSLLTPVIHCKC